MLSVWFSYAGGLVDDSTRGNSLSKLLMLVIGAVGKFITKVLAVLYLFFGLKNDAIDLVKVKSSDHHGLDPTNANSMNHLARHDVTEVPVLPCLERLQMLEELVTELNEKPERVPQEKDNMILDSLNHIQPIEHDLQKTNNVSAFLNPFAFARILSITSFNFTSLKSYF